MGKLARPKPKPNNRSFESRNPPLFFYFFIFLALSLKRTSPAGKPLSFRVPASFFLIKTKTSTSPGLNGINGN